jgi:LCP family protein required for cell wall assembly
VFICALALAGVACTYTGLALLGRIYPALFPGQTLGETLGISAFVAPIPGLSRVVTLDTSSVYNDRINLLVIGVDKRPQFRDFDGYLTDVVMVATIDPIGRHVNVLSFPRDMEIDIHTEKFKYEDRINTSYGVGFRAGSGYEAGAKQVEKDMKENFGIEIDNWVLLDFKGVEKLIDAVGGIDVDIPPQLSVGQWFYSDDDETGRWLSFPPGVQHLDGYRAVAFGRHREYDNDLVRVKRQQLVLQTALQRVFSLGLLNNPAELWDAYNSTVKTDLSKARMLGLVPLLKQTQGRMTTLSIGDPVNGRETVRGVTTELGAAVLEWDPENVQYWLSQTFTKVQWAASNVEIQNGFGDDTIRSSALARYLAYTKGLPTVYLGPDVPVQPDTTITLYGERRPLAEDIAKWVGVPVSAIKTLPKPDGSTLPDVVVVVGKDFKIPGQ